MTISLFLKFAYALLFPLACGWIFAKCFFNKRWSTLYIFERAGIAFLLGQGLLVQTVFLAGWIGLQFSVMHLSYCLVLLTAVFSILVFCVQRYFSSLFQPSGDLNDFKKIAQAPVSSLGHVLLFLVIVFFVNIFFRIIVLALTAPIYTWDSIATSAFQAKVIFYEGGLRLHRYLPHPDFPLHVPFSIVWFSQVLGFFDQQWVKVLSPLYLLAGVVLTVSFCRRMAGKLVSYVSIFIIFGSPLICVNSATIYRDIPLMTYIFMTASALCYGLYLKDRIWVWMAALSISFACFVKSEAVFYIPVFLFAVIIWALSESRQDHLFSKRSVFKYVIDFLVLGSIIPVLYSVYKINAHIDVNSHAAALHVNFPIFVQRSGQIFKRFFQDLFLRANWNIVWPALLIGFIFGVRTLWKDKVVVFLTVLIFGHLGVIFLSAGVGSPKIYHDILSMDTLARLFIHFFPVVVALLMIVWSRILQEDNGGRST